MAATAAAVAAEEDTELRDLLVQTLEGSGVLNRIKVGGRPGRAWRRGAGPRGLRGRRASQRDRARWGRRGEVRGPVPGGGRGGLGAPGAQVPQQRRAAGCRPGGRRVSPDPPLGRRGRARGAGRAGEGRPLAARAPLPPGCALGLGAPGRGPRPPGRLRGRLLR